MLPLATLLALAPSAGATPIVVEGTLCHPRNLMVKIESEAALEAIERSGSRVLKYIPEIQWAVVETPPNRLQATKQQLGKSTGIESCTLDRAAKLAYTPNDPLWTNQWHMRQIKADLAWDTTLGTNSPIVAVLDTGVRVDHEDLAANMWKNAGEIPGNSIDDDHNGYVDDVNGYDFTYGDGNPDDVYGHGTGCAGIVAGRGDNGLGVSGVAPRARIMAIKCAQNDGYFFDSNTVPAYIYAANMGAKVFSMSFYSDRVSQSEEDALAYAWKEGVLPVAAAGNDQSVLPYYPAAYETVLSVAATDGSNNKAGFSNFGGWVDVAAPGVGLTTTSISGGYQGFSGTSGACPHVAGLAALLKGAYKKASRNRLRFLIEDTATLLSQAPYGEFSNYGLVDAQAAMNHIVANTNPAPHAARVTWISPFGYSKATSPLGPKVYLYGRNLVGAVVKYGGVPTTMVSTGRDLACFKTMPSGPVTVEDANGNVIGTFNPPVPNRPVWPLNEGSSVGASVTGGFAQALAPDGQVVTCTRRGDGTIQFQASFRRFPTTGAFKLVIKRSYFGGAVSDEGVQLYRWSAASYPYGPFDDVSVAAPPTGDDLVIDIPSIAPYVDPEGTLLLRIVSTGVPSGGELRLDTAYFKN